MLFDVPLRSPKSQLWFIVPTVMLEVFVNEVASFKQAVVLVKLALGAANTSTLTLSLIEQFAEEVAVNTAL